MTGERNPLTRRKFLKLTAVAPFAVSSGGAPKKNEVEFKPDSSTPVVFRIGKLNFEQGPVNGQSLLLPIVASYRNPYSNLPRGRPPNYHGRQYEKKQKYGQTRRLLVGGMAGLGIAGFGGLVLDRLGFFKRKESALTTTHPSSLPTLARTPERTTKPLAEPTAKKPEALPTSTILPRPKDEPIPTPEIPKLPREDLYPIGKDRSLLNSSFGGAHMYDSEWHRLTPLQAYKTYEEFDNDIEMIKKNTPDLGMTTTAERAYLFCRCWENVSAELRYSKSDPVSPVEALPIYLKEANYSENLLLNLGIMMQLQGIKATKKNLIYMADVLNYQMIGIFDSDSYLLKKGEYQLLLKDLASGKPIRGSDLLSDAVVKTLNWQFMSKLMFYFMGDEKSEINLKNYLRKLPRPTALDRFATDKQLEDRINIERVRLLDLIADSTSDFYKPGVAVERDAPKPSEAVKPIDTVNPLSYWGSVFDIKPWQIDIIKQREGGDVTVEDGILQVTKAVREGSFQRIPADLLGLLIERSPNLQKLFQPKNMTQFLSSEENLQKVRKAVLDNYSYDSKNPALDRKTTEEIQTFWGLWYFSYACKSYGDYLSFLRYNHPTAVYLEPTTALKYYGNENYGFVNQIMKATGESLESAISTGNKIVFSLDNYIRNKPDKSEVIIRSFVLSPQINFEEGRDRFFWRFDIKGIAEVKGKPVPFILRSAHYLWQMNIISASGDVQWGRGGSSLPKDKEKLTLEAYGEDALNRAYSNLDISSESSANKDRRQQLRNKLFDPSGGPTGILLATSTGKGVMDYL